MIRSESETLTMTTSPTPGPARPLAHREIHIKDLFAVVRRHWLLVVMLTGLVAVGAHLSSRRAVPQYQSSLTVQINSPKQVFARLDDIDVDELALRTDPILSEALFLTTQELAIRVVQDLGLELRITNPAIHRGAVMASVVVDTATAVVGDYYLTLKDSDGWELQDASGRLLQSGTYTDPVRGPGFSFRARPTTESTVVPFTIEDYATAALRVSGGLSYRVRDNTNAVDIYYTSSDPTLIPHVLNRAAAELRADGARRARAIARNRRTYIEEQTRDAHARFQEKLAEIQSFKERERITDLTAEEQVVVRSIQDLERDRRLLLVKISTLRDAISGHDSLGIATLNQLAAVEGTGQNAALTFQIHTLLELYDERRTLTAGAMGQRASSPQVAAIDERIAHAENALRGAVEATLKGLGDRMNALNEKTDEQRAILATFPGKETRIAQLQLEANIIDETYRYLLGQFQAARLQEATIGPYVDILDGASTAYGIGPSREQKVIIGALVGLLLGIAGAFFLEYLDQSVKSAADVERVLGIPVLGMVPREPGLRPGAGRGVMTVNNLQADDPAVEAFRALRTNVTFVGADKPVQLIVVTSPGPQEGKSTTATNLAVTMAQNGKRTLLIDGDLRRPQLHRSFSLVAEPGLTDLLIGNVSAREIIRPEAAPGLDLIPSGPPPPNPSELLGSDAMRSLLNELRQSYDYIIMDTPPLLPVTDAAIAATNADATILVVRSGETEEAACLRSLDQLHRVRARVAGAVVNAISPQRDRQYSYYSYRAAPPTRSPLRTFRSRLANML